MNNKEKAFIWAVQTDSDTSTGYITKKGKKTSKQWALKQVEILDKLKQKGLIHFKYQIVKIKIKVIYDIKGGVNSECNYTNQI